MPLTALFARAAPRRSASAAGLGQGPLYHLFVGSVLEKAVKAPGIRGAMLKVALESATWGPAFCVAVTAWNGALQHPSDGGVLAWRGGGGGGGVGVGAAAPSARTDSTTQLAVLYDHVRTKAPAIYQAAFCFWVPIQTFNHFMIPVAYRLLYYSSMGLVWNIYLSAALRAGGGAGSGGAGSGAVDASSAAIADAPAAERQ